MIELCFVGSFGLDLVSMKIQFECLAVRAHKPAAESRGPPAKLNRCCARVEESNLLALLANIALADAFSVARATNVIAHAQANNS